jgi:hypothetical protein
MQFIDGLFDEEKDRKVLETFVGGDVCELDYHAHHERIMQKLNIIYKMLECMTKN